MRLKKTDSPQFRLYVPIADIICELVFDNNNTFSYFKKRYHFLSSSLKSDSKLTLLETSTEFILAIFAEDISCKIKKNTNSSLDDLFFVIQAMIQYEAIKYGIIFIHASSFIKNGKAYLFMAPSGSGKSTIINSVSDKEVLSDDVAVLKKTKNSFQVFTSVFDNKRFHCFPLKKAPLDRIFTIKKASFNRIIKERGSDSLNEILNNNILFWLLELQKGKLLKNLSQKRIELYNLGLDLFASSKIETLYFTKDLKFMSFI